MALLKYNSMEWGISAFELGFILVWIGIFMILIGVLLLGGRGSRGGGVILIGPIPIIWGSDRGLVKWMIVIAAIFLVIYFLIFFYSLFI